MPSLVWLRSLPPRRRRTRSDKKRELLGSHWIDVELGHPFDPHFVTKTRADYARRRVVRVRRAIMVVSVRLFPNSAVFKSDNRMSLEAFNSPVDATHGRIEPGHCGFLGLFGCLHSGLLDLLLGLGLRFFGRFLLSALAITLQVCVEMLQLVLAQFIQACGLEFLRPHRFLDTTGRFRRFLLGRLRFSWSRLGRR